MTMDNVARGSASSPLTLRAFLKNMGCVGSLLGSVLLLPSVLAAFLLVLPLSILTPSANSWAGWQRDMVCQGSCGGGCGPCPSSPVEISPPSYDYGAEQRAREAEEARLRQEEQDRQFKAEQERKRKEKEEAEARFISERDKAAGQLKGSTATGAMTLKGTGGSGLKGEPGLKDALKDSGLKGSQPSATAGPGRQSAVWRQLQCAVSISRYALGALDKMGDYQEFGALSVEALKALDGQRPGVECPSAPSMPDLQGRSVDMEQLKGAQRQILERAAAIAENMKQSKARQTEAKSSVPEPVPANETPDEKMRRIQKELNRINEAKLQGNQKEIDEQEKNRKELAELILKNEKLTSVAFGTSEEAPTTRRRKPIEVPSPETLPSKSELK
jgi:hypothetical protein